MSVDMVTGELIHPVHTSSVWCSIVGNRADR
jgi:hypothetical protein